MFSACHVCQHGNERARESVLSIIYRSPSNIDRAYRVPVRVLAGLAMVWFTFTNHSNLAPVLVTRSP